MADQVPSHAKRQDAEMAIAFVREELNRALAYKKRYDAEGHNLCLAIVELKTGGSAVIAAYSNDSAIPESLRLHLSLVPDVYALMKPSQRFGCDGMAQFHTEPKLLNFLTATPSIREQPFSSATPDRPPRVGGQALYRAVLGVQRRQATTAAKLLPPPEMMTTVTLVSEIACCPTCVAYSINRFRGRFSGKRLETIELGKQAGQPTAYSGITVTRRS
ncbi:hypothetical protein [Falsiroseomonas sp. E2-1-a20]|uniref:hypothetical protein n=1 Tax=Falsiroseomonas sp. E2-1-a20 TaxID=3239300 RepID=UPI003F3EC226